MGANRFLSSSSCKKQRPDPRRKDSPGSKPIPPNRGKPLFSENPEKEEDSKKVSRKKTLVFGLQHSDTNEEQTYNKGSSAKITSKGATDQEQSQGIK